MVSLGYKLFQLLWDPRTEGVRFRSSLSRQSVANLEYAKISFLLCQYLPMLLYYAGVVEKDRKFPASLSYTTAYGTPKYVCLAFWLLGWFFVLSVLDLKADLAIWVFAAQMLLTALISAWVNKPDQTTMDEYIHLATAGLYIADHFVLLKLLGMGMDYQTFFRSFLMLTAVTLYWSAEIKRRNGLPADHCDSAAEWRRMLARLPSGQRCLLWLSEMTFMISENMLFTSFVLGLTSGLKSKWRTTKKKIAKKIRQVHSALKGFADLSLRRFLFSCVHFPCVSPDLVTSLLPIDCISLCLCVQLQERLLF